MCNYNFVLVEIGKQCGKFFLKEGEVIHFYDFENGNLVRKSLPTFPVYSHEEAEYLVNKNGSDCTKNLDDKYIAFFDSECVEYDIITAPLCIYEDGNYKCKKDTISSYVPTKEMLYAAESLFAILIGPMTIDMLKKRRTQFCHDFESYSIDGKCAILNTPLKKDQIPDQFIPLLQKQRKYYSRFFVVRKDAIIDSTAKDRKITFIVPKRLAGFVIGEYGKNAKKMSIMLSIDITIQKN